MFRISAFADEISDDLEVQIKTLQLNGVGFIELRGVWGKNVLALSDQELNTIKMQTSDYGIGFSAIGSPLGKFPIDGDFSQQMEALKRALEIAEFLEAPYIRLFSFYPTGSEDPGQFRGRVLDWLGQMITEAEKTRVILAHENEKGIYGDTGTRCLDLYTALPSPSFTGIFDFANFVQCGQQPYEDCWLKLRPYIRYFHVKDALLSTGQVVPAGQGDGDVEKILKEAFNAGFDNFLTLEPHLSVAETSYGRTTPELFTTAAGALNRILAEVKTYS